MVGFANACVLEADGRAQRHHFVVPAHIHESENDLSTVEHTLTDAVALGACESFCSAEETGIWKFSDKKASADASPSPILMGAWIRPVANTIESQRFENNTPSWFEPPVRIRFQRLTI